MGKIYRILTPEEIAERSRIIMAHGGRIEGSILSQYAGYSNLSAEGMKELISKEYADPEECQNEAPSIREMTEFCASHPGFTIHGYMIGADRHDSRVSAEGVEGKAESMAEVADFAELFRGADEFYIGPDGYCRCWFD